MRCAIDRNARARLLFHAECLDRRTRRPGQHGGCLKRTGLAVLRALLFGFANVVTGRCDPSFDTLAKAAGVCRSTAALALTRLEAAGLLVRVRRQAGPVRRSNAYRFPLADDADAAAGAAAEPSVAATSEFRTQTTTQQKTGTYRELSTDAGPTTAAKRAAVWRSWCDETLAETRGHLRKARHHFARRRAERLRQAQAALSGPGGATGAG